MLMLRYGVWIPQEVARASGGGELLPGVNYDQALRGLKVGSTAPGAEASAGGRPV